VKRPSILLKSILLTAFALFAAPAFSAVSLAVQPSVGGKGPSGSNIGSNSRITVSGSGSFGSGGIGNAMIYVDNAYVGNAVVTANATLGTFTYTKDISVSPNYLHNLQVNVSGAGTATSTIFVDTISPSVSITSVSDTATGAAVPRNGSTTSTNVTVTGTASDSSPALLNYVQISNTGNGNLGNATLSGNNWTFPVTSTTGGLQQIIAKAVDWAGNTNISSYTYTLSGPDPSTVTATIDSTITTSGGLTPTIQSGGYSKSATVTITGNGSVNGASPGKVEVYKNNVLSGLATVSGTTWSYTTPAISGGTVEGNNVFFAKVYSSGVAPTVVSTSTVNYFRDTTSPTITNPLTATFNGAPIASNAAVNSQAIDVSLKAADTGSGLSGSVTCYNSVPSAASPNPIPNFTSASSSAIPGTLTFTSLYTGDGTFNLYCKAWDNAGNFSNVSSLFSYFADSVAPSATLTLNSVPVSGPAGLYYNNPLSFSWNVNDPLPSKGLKSVSIYDGTALLNLYNMTTAATSYSNQIYSVSLQTANPHSFWISATDNVGNVFNPTAPTTGLITANIKPNPTVTITSLTNDARGTAATLGGITDNSGSTYTFNGTIGNLLPGVTVSKVSLSSMKTGASPAPPEVLMYSSTGFPLYARFSQDGVYGVYIDVTDNYGTVRAYAASLKVSGTTSFILPAGATVTSCFSGTTTIKSVTGTAGDDIIKSFVGNGVFVGVVNGGAGNNYLEFSGSMNGGCMTPNKDANIMAADGNNTVNMKVWAAGTVIVGNGSNTIYGNEQGFSSIKTGSGNNTVGISANGGGALTLGTGTNHVILKQFGARDPATYYINGVIQGDPTLSGFDLTNDTLGANGSFVINNTTSGAEVEFILNGARSYAGARFPSLTAATLAARLVAMGYTTASSTFGYNLTLYTPPAGFINTY